MNHPRILLVDDHEDTLTVMKLVLERRGYCVEAAADTRSALRMANEQPFDLVVSDISLPDGSGLDLLQRLRTERPLLGIALSGFGRSVDIERSRKAGFVEHLTKPVDLQKLHETIQRVWQGA